MRENFESANFTETVESERRESEQSKTLEYASELIKNPPQPEWPGHDEFFITAHVEYENGVWQVKIEPGDPSVAINQGANEKFGFNLPLITDLRKDKKNGLSLVSAGSFIWLNQENQSRLVLLKRSEDAAADPGCLTGPAGRCGEKPSETIEAETREELTIAEEILPNGKSRFSLMVFYQNQNKADQAIDQKLRQLTKRQADLSDRYQKAKRRQPHQEAQLAKTLEILRQIRSVEDVTLINLEDCPKNEGALDTVITTVDNSVVDEVKNCLVYFDEQNNTLEIRKSFEYRLPKNSHIALMIDGENFNREVETFASLDELKSKRNLVPALRNYVQLKK